MSPPYTTDVNVLYAMVDEKKKNKRKRKRGKTAPPPLSVPVKRTRGLKYSDSLSHFPNGWENHLAWEKEKEYWSLLMQRLDEEHRAHTIYPPAEDVYAALEQTPCRSVRVVVMGQDPYHGGQATGLAYSVAEGSVPPPSLKNIAKAMEKDLKKKVVLDSLEYLAEQGVLWLNTTLTTRRGTAKAHADFGWSFFTDAVLRAVSDNNHSVVFILWGKAAQEKIPLIDQDKHTIITGVHPSPLSAWRGFVNGRYFSRANEALSPALPPIEWLPRQG